MSLSPRLAVASQSYNLNSSFLKQGLAGLSDPDWLTRPNGHCNHILWIVGHLAYSRSMVLARLGNHWSKPWMHLYARGAKCAESPEAPTPVDMMAAWDESCTRLNAALEAASDELLDMPAPKPGPPSADGLLCGTVNFMALHETYHVGQAAYVRSWLGKPGVMG
jgi:DinB superfamily